MACDTKSVYESLEQCPGQRNLPGIRRRIYYIDKMDIDKEIEKAVETAKETEKENV